MTKWDYLYVSLKCKIALIRQLKENGQLKKNLFASFQPIYVMEELNEADTDDAGNNSQLDFDKSTDLCSSWFSFKKNTTYDYLTELMTKCGANLTSRVALAQIIVAIDKTNDYDSNCTSGQLRLETDRDTFRQSVKQLEKCIRKKQDGIMVVSSDWIIGWKLSIFMPIYILLKYWNLFFCFKDCLLDDSNVQIKEFEITCLNTSL